MPKSQKFDVKIWKILFKMMKKMNNFKFLYQFELRRQRFHAFETTKRSFFARSQIMPYYPVFFSLHDDMRFHQFSREVIQYYLVSVNEIVKY